MTDFTITCNEEVNPFYYILRPNTRDAQRILKESIGGRIAIMNEQRWDRWSIRFSNYPRYKLSANSDVVSKNGITCPEQAGQTKSCGTCGLCWNKSTKRILFMTHSRDLRKGNNANNKPTN